MTRNIVERFSPDVHQLVEEIEDRMNSSTPSPSTTVKTTLLDVSYAATAALRRSTRKRSPSVVPVRRVRGRSVGLVSNEGKTTNSLIKNVPNNFVGNQKLCNGGTLGDYGSQN